MSSDSLPSDEGNPTTPRVNDTFTPIFGVDSGIELDKETQRTEDASVQVTQLQSKQTSLKRRYIGTTIILLAAAVIALVAVRNAPQDNTSINATSTGPDQVYKVQSVPLPPLSNALKSSSSSQNQQTLVINGTLEADSSVILKPIPKPNDAVAGQVYFDKDRNQLAYYNGSQFIYLQTPIPGVTSVGNATGAIALAAGLAQTGGALSNTGVLSIGGQSGTISLGNGLGMNNGVLRNTGVLSITSGTPSLVISNDGNGNIRITNNSSGGSGGGTVSSPGGTTGYITEFTGSQTIADSILTQSGSTVTVNGTLAATTLQGDGSGIVNVNALTLQGNAPSYFTNASNISTGTLSDARLSSNVPLLNANNNFTGTTLQHSGNNICDSSNNCGYLTGSAANGSYVQLQSSTPGTAQSGHFNISGTGIAGSLQATTVYQNGKQVCDTSGNCAGIGGDVTGSGTTDTVALFTNTGSIGNSIITQSGTTVTIAGTLSATNLSGNGSAITNVDAATLNGNASSYFTNATNIATGTLADGRLSANVTLQGNTFNGANELVQLNATGGLPALDGSLLTNLNANNVATGTLADGRLSANVTLQGNTFNGNSELVQLNATAGLPALNGSLLTSLNASNLGSGTVPDARLSSNVPLLNANNNFTGTTLQHSGNNICDSSNNCGYLPDTATAGGDLTGNYPNPTIAKLQGSTLTITTPATGQVLNYNGTAWVNTGSPTVSGLLTVQGGTTVSGGAVALSGNAASSLTTSSGALTLTSAAAATWSTAAGNLTLQAGSGTINLGSSTTLTANGSIAISSGGTGNLTLDTSGTAASIIIGGTKASTIQIGSTTTTATQTVNIGTNNTASSATNVVIGSTVGSSTTMIQGGNGLSAVDIESNAGFISIGDNSTSQFVNIGQGSAGDFVNIGATYSPGVNLEAGSGNISLQDTSPILGTVVQSDNSSNSSVAFSVENYASNPIFNVDTAGNNVDIGNVTTVSGENTTANLVFSDGTTDGFGLSIQAPATHFTANQTITLPNASGTLCLTSQNCSTAGSGYILNQSSTPGTAQTGNFNISGTGIAGTLESNTALIGSGATNVNGETVTIKSSANNYGIMNTDGTISVGTYLNDTLGAADYGTHTNNSLGFFTGGNAVNAETIGTDGSAAFQGYANSASAFQVQDTNGTSMFNISTNNALINDNFTTNAPSGTLINSASWVSGSYVELDNGGPGIDGEVNYTETNVGNSFDAKFDFWSLSGGGDGTWFYAYDTITPSSYHFGTANGGYDFAYSDTDSKAELYFNGTLLASATISAPNNSTWHTAEIVKTGSTMKMYYDNTAVLTYTDSTARALTGSNFGVGGCSCSQSGEHRATNFSLTSDSLTSDAFAQFNTDANVSGQLDAGEVVSPEIQTSSLDTSSSGNLTIGATNATNIIIGTGATGEATPKLLVLDNGTSSSDPSATADGAMYYNASKKSFRCQINGHWDACNGVVSANTTPSNAISNTTTSTAFSGGNGSSYTIPANDCQPGVTYLITARGWYDTTGTPTITWSLDFGSTVLMATGAMPTMSNTVGEAGWKMEATLICDTTGSGGTVEAQGDVTQLTSSTSGLPGYGIDADTGMMSDTSAQTMNTTVSNTIKLYAQWSAASTSNKVELRQLVVQRLGPS